MATTRSTGFVVTAAIWNAVLSGLNDAGNVFTGVSATLSGALTAASATLSGTLKEYGRSVAQGVEIPVTFASANFGADVGDFVVAVGNVAVNSYTLIGKQLFWSVRIAGAAIDTSSTPPTALIFTIPDAFTVAVSTTTAVGFFTDGTNTRAYALASGSTVRVARSDGGAFALNTNGTHVYFDVRIPIG